MGLAATVYALCITIAAKFDFSYFFFSQLVHTVYYLWTHKFHFSATFSLKMDSMILFTYLKIILLQYFSVFCFIFQFSVFSCIQTDPKYRSVMFNLNDPKNPYLRRKVLLGEIKPVSLVTMNAEEMANHKSQSENIQIQLKRLKRCVHDANEEEKATTDMFQCSRCCERKCTYYQMQTRSADEPMTTYVTCVKCNKHWKV